MVIPERVWFEMRFIKKYFLSLSLSSMMMTIVGVGNVSIAYSFGRWVSSVCWVMDKVHKLIEAA